MWEEVDPEKEVGIIEKVANKIVDLEMEFPAKFFLGFFFPMAYVAGQLSRVFLTAWDFMPLPFEYIPVFEKRENVRKLIQRLDELAEEKEERKKRIKKEDKKEGWRRLIKSFWK